MQNATTKEKELTNECLSCGKPIADEFSHCSTKCIDDWNETISLQSDPELPEPIDWFPTQEATDELLKISEKIQEYTGGNHPERNVL